MPSLFAILAALLLVLKLCGVAAVSWWLILAVWLGPAVLVGVVLFGILAFSRSTFRRG